MRLLDLCVIRPHARPGEPLARLGVPLLDEYLRFLAGRCRPNTMLAAAYDAAPDGNVINVLQHRDWDSGAACCPNRFCREPGVLKGASFRRLCAHVRTRVMSDSAPRRAWEDRCAGVHTRESYVFAVGLDDTCGVEDEDIIGCCCGRRRREDR